jgi:hypothetical protein
MNLSGKESSTYVIDGYGVSLATGYGASSVNRNSAFDVLADTGSTDLTGDTYLGAVRGRTIIGTTQTNASINGINGIVDVGNGVDFQGNLWGGQLVLDFYGDSTVGSGASCFAGGIGVGVWNEGTTTLGAGAVLAGIDLYEIGAVGAYGSNSRNPAINIRGNWSQAMYAAIAATGSTARNLIDLEVTDTQTISTGYSRGLYINWTKTGAQTGGAVNLFAIDFAATTANCTEVALESHYLTQTGNKLTGNVFIWQCYVEDVGTAVGNVCLIDIGAVAGTGHSASRYAFMRCKQHSSSYGYDEIFYIEGTSNHSATNLFTFCGAGDLCASGSLSGSILYKIKVLVESIPGGGGTTGYIPVYEN